MTIETQTLAALTVLGGTVFGLLSYLGFDARALEANVAYRYLWWFGFLVMTAALLVGGAGGWAVLFGACGALAVWSVEQLFRVRAERESKEP